MSDSNIAERHQAINFFEEQAQAMLISRLLFVPFFISAILTAMATAGVILVLVEHYLFDSGFRLTMTLWLLGSALVAAIIVVASMVKMHDLESGDLDSVVRNVGAQHLTSINTGILTEEQAYFRNVVAEMSIASGMPMPQLYVMDHEININALSLGKDRNNAAMIFSHGAVRMLERDELQALAAHEFSHILNGDIFLNVRLMGVTYGLSFVTLAGLQLLSGEGVGVGLAGRILKPVFLAGIALVIIGSFGHFFALLIKHFIVRQRKKLADAATLQFARDSKGAANVLKKIKANKRESFLIAHTAHFEHMLFAPGKRFSLLSGHQSLDERILYFDPYYHPRELDALRKTMKIKRGSVLYDKREQKSTLTAKEIADKKKASIAPDAQWFSPENIMDQIGTMRIENLITASMLLSGLPQSIKTQIYNPDWSSTIAIFLLLSNDSHERANELSQIAAGLSSTTKQQIMSVMSEPSLASHERLPILEVLIAMLKQRPVSELEQTSIALQKLVDYQQDYTPFSYALTRAYSGLTEVDQPTSGDENDTIESLSEAVTQLLALVSIAGHDNLDDAQKAFAKAQRYLPEPLSQQAFPELGITQINADAFVLMDKVLAALRKLNYPGKQQLVDALVHVVCDDGRLSTEEQELFRITCFVLGIPVPLLQHYRQAESVRVTQKNLREYMGE